jgi:hypothetical protein
MPRTTPSLPSSRRKAEKPCLSIAEELTGLFEQMDRHAAGLPGEGGASDGADAVLSRADAAPTGPPRAAAATQPTTCRHWALPLLRPSAVRAAEVVGADLAAVVWPAADGSLRFETLRLDGEADSPDDEETLSAAPGGSLAACALDRGSTVTSDRLDAERRFSDPALARRGVVAAAAVPLVSGRRRFGALVVGRVEAHPFGERDLRRLNRAGEALTGLLSALGPPVERGAEDGGTAESPPSRSRRNRRRSPRQPYRYVQPITTLPDRAAQDLIALCEVECDDISGGGISLILDAPPEFEKFIIALGRGAHRVRLGAKVVNVRPAERDGRQVFLVGCEFLNRLDR